MEQQLHAVLARLQTLEQSNAQVLQENANLNQRVADLSLQLQQTSTMSEHERHRQDAMVQAIAQLAKLPTH